MALALAAVAPAAHAAPTLKPVGSFSDPVAITAPPGDPDRLMVTEKGGTVREVKDGVVQSQPFLDVTSITRSAEEERGLLSIAFPPDYQQTGLFYAYLTANNPLGQIQIREFHRADADHAAPGTGRLVLAIQHDQGNHNGGQLQFTPDGMLWIGVGDGGGSNDSPEHNAQNLGSLKGKLLRIDPRATATRPYTVPADNPFGSEVWAFGLRNPWRFSFDREQPHDLVIGDVGQDAHEEIDYAPAANLYNKRANYGWPCWEGFTETSNCTSTLAGTTKPIIDQPHSDGWCAIIGGVVVRDAGLPTLNGRYLYGDFCQPRLHATSLASPDPAATAGLSVAGLSAVGEDACGHVYTASLNGPVSQIVDGAPSPCPPPAGTGGPPPSAPPPPTDSTAPKLVVRISGRRGVAHRRYLRLRITASERCRLTVTSSRIPHVGRFRTAHRTLRANRRITVRLWLAKPVAKRLQRHRTAKVKLRIRARDAVGNERLVTRRVRLRR